MLVLGENPNGKFRLKQTTTIRKATNQQCSISLSATKTEIRKEIQMKVSAINATIVAVVVLASGVASAATVSWKGVTWTMYGSNTTASINGNGGLDITVLSGQSGDPTPDNWVLKGFLDATSTPGASQSIYTQATAPWVQITFTDTYTGDPSVGGPRCFLDPSVNGVESMFQGGVIAGYSNNYLNHNVYDANNGGWANDPNNWYVGPTRTAGEHTILIGMRTDGQVDMWFDGVLGQTIAASPDVTQFNRMWLGVTAPSGTTFTATYDDLQWGTGYVAPVPEPASLAFLGLGGLLLLPFSRRMLCKSRRA